MTTHETRTPTNTRASQIQDPTGVPRGPRSNARHRARVLFLNGGAELYGADWVFYQAVTGLDRDRFEPIVVLNNPGPLADRLRERGIDVRFLRLGVVRRKYVNIGGLFNRLWYSSRAAASLTALVRRERIDVVYSNTCNVTSGAPAAWLMRRLHVLHLQEILVSPAVAWRVLSRYFGALSHQVIATSNPVRDHLCARVPRARQRTVVVHNGVDPARFAPADPAGSDFRQTLGLDQEHCIVGMIGRVNRRKGHEVLIEAAARLAARLPHLRWIVVGGAFTGEEIYRDGLIADVERRGLGDTVLFQDYHAVVERIYPALDLLISPSPFPESFGLVLVEAMACEVPVIATRHGGPLDVVVEGETGLFVAPGDAEALAHAVARLARDAALRERMGRAGRRRVLDHFTAEQFQSKVNRVLAHLVETRRGCPSVP